MNKIFARKVGMTRIFTEGGESVPVTVLEVKPNVVVQVKTVEKEGYSAVQVALREQKPQRVNRALSGHFAKAKRGVFKTLREIRTAEPSTLNAGDELKLQDQFAVGSRVDVTGVTIGKGYAGVMKRHHMKGNPMTRGTHEYRRHGGSIGCRKFPGRVFKNKRMAGHMGVDRVTQQGLQVVQVRPDEHLLLVRGSVPGPKNSMVEVSTAVKG